MLASDIITLPVREEINDTGTIPRWTDAELMRALTAGLNRLWELRPDAFYLNAAIVVTPPVAVTLLTATVPILDQFKQALVDFICHRAFLRDSDDQANIKRSEVYLNRFIAGIS